MRIAFVVNDVATEVDEYTTTRLARAAARAGHETWYVGVGDLEHGSSNGSFVGRAHAAQWADDDTLATFMARIQDRDAQRIVLDDLDAVFLRNESIDDLQERPWASPLGVVFGQMLGVSGCHGGQRAGRTAPRRQQALPRGVPRVGPAPVARDPGRRTRSPQFVDEVGHCVVKPLYGAKGRNVFMIDGAGETNLAQMTEAVLQDGYAIVQEFVEGARTATPGSSCSRDGSSNATGCRPPSGGCPPGTTRAPTSARGASRCPSRSASVELGIVEAMSDKLVADGMFLVGIDVIGGKVVEINAESPGGLQSVERLYDVDVAETIIDALERRAGTSGS